MDQGKQAFRFILQPLGWALILVAALSVYSWLDSRKAAGEAFSGDSIPGSSAPSFELPDLEERTVNLQDFRGKVVLLNFWGTTCAPCIREIPWLVEFQSQYASSGLQVVAVSMYGEKPEELKAYVTKRGMQQLKVLVGNDDMATLFRLVAYPTTFLLDRDGKHYSIHEGLIDRVQVASELTALLNRPDESHSLTAGLGAVERALAWLQRRNSRKRSNV